MLSQTVMGSVALFAMWIATLLVLASAAKEGGRWWRRWRALPFLREDEAGLGVIRGRVVGPGPLARHSVLQTGRWGAVPPGSPRVVIFHDRSYRSEVFGGAVQTEGGRIVEVASVGEAAEVWAPGPERVSVPDLDFEGSYERSKQTRGFERTLEVELGAGAPVWVSGQLRRDGDRWQLEAPPGGSLMVSAVDPRALAARKLRLNAAVMAGFLVSAVVATALAVWPPRFGTRSIIGATLCLAYFLIVQPLAGWLRDALLVPSHPIVRGSMMETLVAQPAETLPPARVH